MTKRLVVVAAVSAAGVAGAALLAFAPYATREHPGSTLTVRCGSPALAWRTEAEVSGGPFAGTGGASVETHPACGKGVAERLAIALAVLAASNAAAAGVALTGRS